MAVSRDQVVRTGVALLDRSGLAGVTLRALAAELGVQAPALYWHVRNKRELLDLMAEEIIESVLPDSLREPTPGQPWWDWLTQRCRAFRAGLLAHPDSALVVSGNRPTWRVLPQVERQLGALVAVGFPADEALQAMLALGEFVTGSVLEQQATAARPPRSAAEDQVLHRAMAASDRFPMLAASAASGPPDDTDTFEYGLRLMVDGLRARLLALHGLDPVG